MISPASSVSSTSSYETISSISDISKSQISSPLSDTVPTTSASGPPNVAIITDTTSPPAIQSKAANTAPRWHISPHRISSTSCPCLNISERKQDNLVTSEDCLKFNLGRITTVYNRTTRASKFELPINDRILEACERVLRELRERGLELFHFCSRVLNDDELGDRNKRLGMTIYFLVPDSNPHPIVNQDSKDQEDAEGEGEGVGHRFIAEILIQIHNNGRSKNQIENIATRFYEDHNDWKLSQPYTYYTLDHGPRKLEMIIRDKPGRAGNNKMSWDQIVNGFIMNLKILKPNLIVNAGKLIPIITRVTKELKVIGLVVFGFEFELVYRDTSNGRIKRVMRIGLKTFDKTPTLTNSTINSVIVKDEDPQGNQNVNARANDSKSDVGNHDTSDIGAVLLLELEKDKIKNVAVLYQGEWPVVHFYRNTIPPPNLDGLERLVR